MNEVKFPFSSKNGQYAYKKMLQVVNLQHFEMYVGIMKKFI